MRSESKPVYTDESADLAVATAVVTAISELGRCDPVDLDFCLADHVDPEAMEALFTGARRTETALTMSLGPYEVSVRTVGDETIVTARDGVRHSRRVVHR
jgi:hypothetical protein